MITLTENRKWPENLKVNNNVVINADDAELEMASQNLPPELFITSFSLTSKKEELQNLLICMDENGAIKEVDDVIYSSQKSFWTEVVETKNQFASNYVHTLKMDLSKVPEHVQSIDFYACNVMKHVLNDLQMTFQDSKYKEFLMKKFSFKYQTKYDGISYFLGTFSRVSDGWKFYPKFESLSSLSFFIVDSYPKAESLQK